MSFTVIIPARLASTRLPNKPIADICGKPMIVRVAEQALKSGASRVICAVDDELILKACEANGIEACLTRKDHACGTDRLCEAAEVCKIPDDEIIVNVQGDEPLIPPKVIKNVAELLMNRSDCSMGTAAIRIHSAEEFFNPNVVKVVADKNGSALYFSRAPIPWDRDGFAKDRNALPRDLGLRHVGIYSYRCAFLKAYPQLPKSDLESWESLEQLRALYNGYKIAVDIFEEEIPPGVDTLADLEAVRAYLQKKITRVLFSKIKRLLGFHPFGQLEITGNKAQNLNLHS